MWHQMKLLLLLVCVYASKEVLGECDKSDDLPSCLLNSAATSLRPTISDPSEVRSREKEGGVFDMNSKAVRKERKYYRYAFLVLLGIFGLTGPLVMKTLAIIAAHSLMAAKAALIIVGGVALKKLFEHKGEAKVKVTHVPLDESHEEHDRFGFVQGYLPYGYSKDSKGPYSAYYSEDGKEKDSIVYGSPYSGSDNSLKIM